MALCYRCVSFPMLKSIYHLDTGIDAGKMAGTGKSFFVFFTDPVTVFPVFKWPYSKLGHSLASVTLI